MVQLLQDSKFQFEMAVVADFAAIAVAVAVAHSTVAVR